MKIILCGGTRIVVLWGDKAFKIARFRPIRFLCRMIVLPFQAKRKHDIFRQRYGHFHESMLNYICAGLLANRGEFEYWQRTADSRVVSIHRQFFRCTVIVQPRGISVTTDELEKGSPFSSFPEELQKAIRHDQPYQFIKIQGKIYLTDYGDPETRAALISIPVK